MTEKRDLKSCLLYYVSHLLNHILILVKLTMKYTAPIKVFFFGLFNKKRTKTKSCLYIYDPISSDGPAYRLQFSSLLT